MQRPKDDSPKKAFKAGVLGRRVTVTGVDFVFRPQPTIYLLWALGDEETRRVIEAAHERAIERVLEWIEDEAAVIRYGKDGIYRVRPPGGLVAARFRHCEARSGRPLLHDHLLVSVKGQRLDGKWGSIHTTALHENTVAASALYNEIVAAEVCEALGLATEPRTVTPGRRPEPSAGISRSGPLRTPDLARPSDWGACSRPTRLVRATDRDKECGCLVDSRSLSNSMACGPFSPRTRSWRT
ncbi:MobF family relaxase [Streptomyces sp. NPDC001093]|uniref:MobF family relaxase n=1 Tax=Streptomyces sp. NPDC001093 TaxID=3154376 RepID=UPI003331B1FA